MGVAPRRPGMPDRHSTPASPSSTQRATNGSHSSPACARTSTPRPGDASMVTPRVATCTTVPGKPSSATTRLLPPPRTRTSSPASSAARTAPMSSSSVVASTKRRAGPVGDEPAALGHGEHAVRDHVGQADGLGEVLVPVDRVEVAGRARVLDQVQALDREGARGDLLADLDLVVLHRGGHASGPPLDQDVVGRADVLAVDRLDDGLDILPLVAPV